MARGCNVTRHLQSSLITLRRKASMPNSNGGYALKYAERGWKVFPCRSDKSPKTVNGFHDATTDYATIRNWWTVDSDALIGVAVPDEHVIIDVDPRNGGDEYWAAFAALHDWPGCYKSARTGSGGLHLWFRLPAGFEVDTLRSTVCRGVDLKRPGKGYVIVPPSVSDAGPYEWIDDKPATRLSLKHTDALLRPARVTREQNPDIPESLAAGVSGTRYGLAALENRKQEVLSAVEGERNNVLYANAAQIGRLVAGNQLDEHYALEQLQWAAGEIGLDDREIWNTLESGFDSGVVEPLVPEGLPQSSNAVLRDFLNGARTIATEQTYWTDWQGDYPEPEFYLDPLLPKNAYVLVYGSTEASKSMVWNAILAQGSHHGLKSSIYSLENPRAVDVSRLRRLAPNRDCFRITHEPINLSDPIDVQSMVDRDKGQHVILIDTYSHAYQNRQGDGNEQAIAFAQTVRHIMAETGATVIVLDHSGYQNQDEPRDASAKRQQVDTAFSMRSVGQWQRGQRQARFTITNFKAARLANPFQDVRGNISDTDDGGLALEWSSADFASRWSV